LFTAVAEAATPNDLIIAVSAVDGEVLDKALAEAERLLQSKQGQVGEAGAGNSRPKTLRSAVKGMPAANLAVISVAGRYAAEEAWQALRLGLHVLLFSDNVSLEDEIALKRYAADHGLLLMGPGAGTAILNGVALGFANVIPPGPVGIVSAAGTGLQEVSTLLAKEGSGITQGIGTGGRDLKESVGGVMMLSGLQALQEDSGTKVIVLVSKPPAPSVAQRVLNQVAQSDKPTVVCFMGADAGTLSGLREIEGRSGEEFTNKPAVFDVAAAAPTASGADPAVYFARTLEEAALLAACLARGEPVSVIGGSAGDEAALRSKAAGLRDGMSPGQKYLRGLFSGGTLCYEAQVIWRDMIPEPVLSNAPLEESHQLPKTASAHSSRGQGHTAVDLGEEEYTVGRPHPMIDNDLRIRRLLQEAQDPETSVIMLDVVLGYGAHPDPAAELGPAVARARQIAQEDGRKLAVVASITGTDGDPQGMQRQARALEEAGVVLCSSNAAAARLTAYLVCGTG
jgi:succinyl-CoA synthetase alpha subunit